MNNISEIKFDPTVRYIYGIAYDKKSQSYIICIIPYAKFALKRNFNLKTFDNPGDLTEINELLYKYDIYPCNNINNSLYYMYDNCKNKVFQEKHIIDILKNHDMNLSKYKKLTLYINEYIGE